MIKQTLIDNLIQYYDTTKNYREFLSKVGKREINITEEEAEIAWMLINTIINQPELVNLKRKEE